MDIPKSNIETMAESDAGQTSVKRKRDSAASGNGEMSAKQSGNRRSYEVLVAINRRAKSIFDAFIRLVTKAETFQDQRANERQDRFNSVSDSRDNLLEEYPVDLDAQVENTKLQLVNLLRQRYRRDRQGLMNDKPSLEAFIYVPGGDVLHYEGIQWRVNVQDTVLQEIFLANHGLEMDDLLIKPDIKKRWKIFDINTAQLAHLASLESDENAGSQTTALNEIGLDEAGSRAMPHQVTQASELGGS